MSRDRPSYKEACKHAKRRGWAYADIALVWAKLLASQPGYYGKAEQFYDHLAASVDPGAEGKRLRADPGAATDVLLAAYD